MIKGIIALILACGTMFSHGEKSKIETDIEFFEKEYGVIEVVEKEEKKPKKKREKVEEKSNRLECDDSVYKVLEHLDVDFSEWTNTGKTKIETDIEFFEKEYGVIEVVEKKEEKKKSKRKREKVEEKSNRLECDDSVYKVLEHLDVDFSDGEYGVFEMIEVSKDRRMILYKWEGEEEEFCERFATDEELEYYKEGQFYGMHA